MFETEEIRKMNIYKTGKIRDCLCSLVCKEDFSQTAIQAVWDITETETNMIDALDIKKKFGRIDMNETNFDLFISGKLIKSFKNPKTLVAVCTCNTDFKNLLEEMSVTWCMNDLTSYKEIVVITNFWNAKLFDKYKENVLDFSITDDIKIGFFLATDYCFTKILRIS